jgi:hypothetical protein
MAVIDYNSKADEYVSCWLCDHFQRYQPGTEPILCSGECRYPAPECNKFILQNDQNIIVPLYFPVILNSPHKWCAKFERTREKNLPPTPPDVSPETCENVGEFPADWIEFWEGDEADPTLWNKKTGSGYVSKPADGISCWNCDNFQYATGPEAGRCVFQPPQASGNGTYGGANPYYEQLDWPFYDSAPKVWCSQWQRRRHAAPISIR